MSKLNLNRLVDNKQNFLETLYFKHKDQTHFEFDISDLLNRYFKRMKENVPSRSKNVVSEDPNAEIIFHTYMSDILGDLGLWFFNPNESIYQIISLGFIDHPKLPNGIFGKQDNLSISIQSEDSLRLNYMVMGNHFKSIEMQGIYDVLSKAYFAKKVKSSTVFKGVKLKLSVKLNQHTRAILEASSFNLNEIEAAIHSSKKSLTQPLSVFFLDNPDYDKNSDLYLRQLDLNKFHFKTEEAYRRFLQYIINNPKKNIPLSAVQEFQNLDEAVVQAFTVSK